MNSLFIFINYEEPTFCFENQCTLIGHTPNNLHRFDVSRFESWYQAL